MINWNIKNSKEKRENWFFPSFEVQEYLLPVVNVGVPIFDEYSDTTYELDDCMRLRNVIASLMETLSLTNKSKIRYETIYKGLESLDKSLIIETLENLDAAANLAIKDRTALFFYGD
ncbi:hypothetical protein [Microbulbifer sp.]|uniref:hypothetical protein n=1 Tax=Microbulbifer sp. TaxID=1908541 RepID=UPI00258DAADB|nr:hypothetical protein [Microbulbifer sp.]